MSILRLSTQLVASQAFALVAGLALPESHRAAAPLHHRSTYGNSSGSTIAPKVFILNAFTPEAESFYTGGELDLLAQNITVPGLSPRFPDAHCTKEGDVCQVTVGEGEINAATSVASLVASSAFDLKKTYFLIAGIAGINPHEGTTGSVTFARFEVQVALQYEFDVREIGANFSTGYIPYGTKTPAPDQYPQNVYGTEVFEVNDALRSLAIEYASTATLNDSTVAQEFRKNFPYAPANEPPTVVACDGATSDVFYNGNILSEAFGNFTTLLTNGTGVYCATAQEDSAMLEAFLRATISGLVDFSRIIVMRTAANFDRPPPNIPTYQNFFFGTSGGFLPSVANLYLAGIKIIDGIRDEWSSKFEAGIAPTNYIGDIYGSLGGVPDFGPFPFFGEA